MKQIKFLIVIISFLFICISCKEDDSGDDDGGSPTSSYCQCEDAATPLTVVVSSAPKMVFLRLPSTAYGANNVFFYKLDSTENGYFYTGTQTKVEIKILAKKWTVPSNYIWAAGRAGTDGYDPLVPVLGDEFVYPYLPWTPGFATWESSTGESNDKTTCPGGSGSYSLPLCAGKDGNYQLDTKAVMLEDNQWYLVRMVMGYSVNGTFNFTTSCYQKIFKFERGTY